MPDRSSSLRWLAPTAMEGRRGALAASTARVVGWTMAACGLAGLAAGTLFFDPRPSNLLLCAGAIAVGVGTIALARLGYPRAAGFLAVGGSFAIVALGTWAAEHLLGPSTVGFFAMVIVAGLTLGGLGGVVTAAVSTAYLATLAYWLRAEPAVVVDPGRAVVAQGIVLMGVAVLLQFVRGRIDDALGQAESHELDLEARTRELESERERFQVMSENSQHLITELDLEGNILYASPNHREVLGWGPEELVGRDWLKVMHPEAQADAQLPLEEQLRGGEFAETCYRVRHRDGSILWLESMGRVFRTADGETRLLGVTRDVTERVALETQLRQSQKLEAVGLLAGGVAHDFNNLLTVIDLNSEILLGEDRFSEELAIQEIQAASQRAQSLTRQLLAFSRRQPLRPRVVDLEGTIRDVETLLLRVLGEHVTLMFHPSLEPLHVLIDPTELEQVVLNLVVNARDALPEGGRIEITTRRETRSLAEAGEAKESWAVLEVRDEGEGMGPDVMSRVFEPFFTTKEVGEGTGLGLAVVHGIVEQSGGRIEVESEPGRGTCFRVYLRRVEPTELEAQEARPPSPRATGAETILLAEDDRVVLRLVRSILEEGGYRVIEAASGLEALSLLQRGEETIDLLLTDVVMPKVSGRELGAQLAELRPGTPTVYMSGYPDRGRREPSLDPLPGDRVIGKPFKRSELLSMVRSALDGRV